MKPTISIEASLLSICLTYPDLLPKIRTIIQPDMFANKKNGVIFNTALELYDLGKSVDTVTVSSEILGTDFLKNKFGEEMDVQDSFMSIMEVEAKPENFQDYSDIVVRAYRKAHASIETHKTAEKIKACADASSVVESLTEKIQELERSLPSSFFSCDWSGNWCSLSI